MSEFIGFLNIDKPSGPTSFQVCEAAGKILNQTTGHAGTLDPKVTGVLPIAVGKATKLLMFLPSDKEYVGVMHVNEDIDIKKLEKIIKSKFIGKIKQIPPKKSAVKREEREREVHEFKILEKEGNDVLFSVRCQAGTYIRKLVHDLGEEIGGAHMLELRRTKAGMFEEKDSITLFELSDSVKVDNLKLTPIEVLENFMPRIDIKPEFIEKMYNGSPLHPEFIQNKQKLKEGQYAAVFCSGKLIEIVKVVLQDNVIASPVRVIRRDYTTAA